MNTIFIKIQVSVLASVAYLFNPPSQVMPNYSDRKNEVLQFAEVWSPQPSDFGKVSVCAFADC